MFSIIDSFLNKITIYKLALYCLTFLWIVGFLLSFFKVLPFGPLELLISLCVMLVACLAINKIFAFLFKAPSNTESSYITAMILSLIAGPEKSLYGFLLLVAVCALAMSSKYLLAINKKHIFNPAAFGLVVATFAFNYYPSWWIGDVHMLVFVLLAGILITRKIQRTELVLSFLIVFTLVSLNATLDLQMFFTSIKNIFAYSPIVFFSMVMLTEPTTTPPTKRLQILYGALTAFLLAPFFHIGSIYFAPESALVATNIFSYLVSPKEKLLLKLKEKKQIAKNTYDFIFHSDKRLSFRPGQYLEWTLAHPKQDSRGMRRYFTIASSPTEADIKIGVKFYQKPSSYKKALENLHAGDQIVCSQLAGEFTLPQNKNKKLVFLAGGIGITPFRSMMQYLLDTNEKRNVTLFYANEHYSDIAYREVFDKAEQQLGIKTIYTLNNTDNCPPGFVCQKGFVTMDVVGQHVPDFKERFFYISGPRVMIVFFEKTLKDLGIPKSHIKTDFFPGYA